MTHDDVRRPEDVRRGAPGPGMHMTFRCWGCNLHKSTAGKRQMKVRGLIRAPYFCADCVASKERKAA